MSASLPILGYYGHNNAGDEAFKIAFSQALGSLPHRYVGRLPEGQRTALTVFGGGALLNDYFIKSLTLSNRTYVVGCSFPYGAKDIEKLVPLKEKIAGVYLRSRKDVDVAKAAGFDASFIPDMVFSVKPERTMSLGDLVRKAVLAPIGHKATRRKLFVFLSGDYWVDFLKGDRKRFEEIEYLKERLAKALDVASQNYDIIMPSMSVWHSARDYMFACDVLKRMQARDRVCLIEQYVDASDLISVIASTDCAIMSMKYHGLVFGLLNDRFCINLGSTRKTLDLMEDFGIPELSFDSRKQKSDQLVRLLSIAEDATIKKKIASTSEVWRSEAKRLMSEAMSRVRRDFLQLGT